MTDGGARLLRWDIGNWQLIGDGDGRRARRDLKQTLKNSVAINSFMLCLTDGWIFHMGAGEGDARIQAFSDHSSLTEGDGAGAAWRQ